MPRGVPKAGFRKTKNTLMNVGASAPVVTVFETDAEIEAKLGARFAALDIMADATGRGINRSLIVSGPAGLGKSFTIESKLSDLASKGHQVTHIKGYVRPMALYQLLYNSRSKKAVLVFDDADSIFGDDVSMNLLKGACDSTETRRLSWLSSSLDRMEGEVPDTFDFEGSVIFITNYDFDHLISTGSKMAPHFTALISRSHYLDLAMKTKRDYMVRIKQVVRLGMLKDRGFSKTEEIQILDFIETNMEKMRELSLRMVIKISTLLRMTSDWRKLAAQTCMKN